MKGVNPSTDRLPSTPALSTSRARTASDTRQHWVVAISIGCDVAITITKFIAAAISASPAMLAEAIHSVVDSLNGVLLLYGMHASRKPANADHPFGHGKEIYFWSLIVAVLIFAIGGGMSIHEGFTHMSEPMRPGSGGWDYAVLGSAAVFELISVVIAARDFRRTGRPTSLWTRIHTSKDPTVFTVLLDNAAAVLGLAIAFFGIFFGRRFHMPLLDALASVLIGVMLAGVALVLVIESKGLLIGEGVDKQTRDRIRALALSDSAVVNAGAPLTMYFGPTSILLALDVEFQKGLSATEVTAAVDRLEKSVRSEYPEIERIFIEAEALAGTRAGQARAR